MTSLYTGETLTGSASRRIELSPNELTLHLLASGLMALSRAFEKGGPLRLPYPAPLQQGLNRVVVASLQAGVEAPQSLAELLAWCRRPLSQWPLSLTELGAEVDGEAPLLDGSLPTSFCEAWACASGDVEAELSERRLLRDVLATCQGLDSPEIYVAFRRLLIERPVLSEWQMLEQLALPLIEPLDEHIRSAYEPAPAACITSSRQLLCCPTCGNLLLRMAKGRSVCEEERCRRAAHTAGIPLEPRELRAKDGILWLNRGLRRFVAAPGRAELRLEAALRERGLEVELWPEFDRYDLRLRFADGEAWAVDVKDWAEPSLLARRVNAQAAPFTSGPPWSRAFFVFPQERQRERPDYVRAFENHCHVLADGVDAAFEVDFLEEVERKTASTCAGGEG